MKANLLTAALAILAAATMIFAEERDTTDREPGTAGATSYCRIIGLACNRTGLQEVMPELAPATQVDLKPNGNRHAVINRGMKEPAEAAECRQMTRLDADTVDTIVIR
jgi:hypothetical protein